MAYDFPASPTDGQEYTPPVGGQTYIYQTPRWLVKGVPPAGGGGGGGISEAPTDGQQYGRQSSAWSVVTPNPTWSTLTGKPATFPPTLPILESDVTNLVTDLGNKEPKITGGTASQYWRGDKSWQTLDKAAVGLTNVDNTSDVSKPVSTATQNALNLKADLASPVFSGNPTAPTATAGTSTTQIATTAFVTAADALKANIASPTLTGTPAAPTASPSTNTTQIATTAFVAAAITAAPAPPALATVSATAPASPQTGQIWWNTTRKELTIWDGSAWQVVVGTWA